MTAHANLGRNSRRKNKFKSPIEALVELAPGPTWIGFLLGMYLACLYVSDTLLNAVEPLVAGDSIRGFLLGLNKVMDDLPGASWGALASAGCMMLLPIPLHFIRARRASQLDPEAEPSSTSRTSAPL